MTVTSLAPWLPEIAGAALAWLRDFSTGAGLGGVAAFLAAVTAYRGLRFAQESENTRATQLRNQEERLAREDRWWAQARWAADKLSSSDQGEVTVGAAALAHLVDEGTATEAMSFASRISMEALEQDGLGPFPERDSA